MFRKNACETIRDIPEHMNDDFLRDSSVDVRSPVCVDGPEKEQKAPCGRAPVG